MFWYFHNSLDAVQVARRYRRGNLYSIECVHACLDLLQKRNDNCELCFGRNVPNFDLHDVLAVRINSSNGCLSSLALCLLELFLSLLFIFDYALNSDVLEFNFEFVNG